MAVLIRELTNWLWVASEANVSKPPRAIKPKTVKVDRVGENPNLVETRRKPNPRIENHVRILLVKRVVRVSIAFRPTFRMELLNSQFPPLHRLLMLNRLFKEHARTTVTSLSFSLKAHWRPPPLLVHPTSTLRLTKFRNVWIGETKEALMMGLRGF